MPSVTIIYEKPTCSTCREVIKAFREHGVAFEDINYILDPPSRAELERIVRGVDVEPRAMVRTQEEAFKALGVDAAALTAAKVVEILAAHPALMQRPVIVHKGKYLLGRPADKVRAWLAKMR